MKRIIITGATSMIGVALSECASKNNVDVYAIVRPNTTRKKRLPQVKNIHVIECELDKLSELNLIGEECDVFYHFAWSDTDKIGRYDPILQEKNIQYTLAAVELANKCGCHTFIGAGSQAEYGQVNEIINAETKCEPQMAYGVAKYVAGKLSKILCDKYCIKHIWCRIFSVYGRYDNQGTMLDYAIKCFLNNEKAIFSAGLQKWDYLHEEDIGQIFYLIGEKIKEHKSYRVAYGESRKLREYVEIVAQKMNAEELCVFSQPTSQVLLGLEADVEDLYKDIQYHPHVTFEEGIQKMINFYVRNDEIGDY